MKINNEGTPKNIKEAITRALRPTTPLEPVKHTIKRIHYAVKDYQAQKFTMALLSVKSIDEEMRLRRLWDLLTKED